jgi:ankyrin repeat protein
LLTTEYISQRRLNAKLFAAIEAEDIPKAIKLLDEGADPNARQQPMPQSFIQLLKQLLQRSSITAASAPTPLVVLLRWRHSDPVWHERTFPPLEQPQLVFALLEHGADPNVSDGSNGDCLLYRACKDNHLLTAQLLIEYGANPNWRQPKSDLTPLHIASVENERIIVTQLLDHGANVNVQDKHGWTALMFAVLRDNPSIISLLVSKQADVSIKNDSGKTVFTMMADWTGEEAQRQLLEKLLRKGGSR